MANYFQSVAPPPTSFTHITSFFTSTLPPKSTQVVISGQTFTASTPGGQVTIPVVSASVLPPAPGASQAPAESQPAQNSPVPTAPLQVENAAVQQGASLGAFIAGLAALLL